jgi:hypothetical protein
MYVIHRDVTITIVTELAVTNRRIIQVQCARLSMDLIINEWKISSTVLLLLVESGFMSFVPPPKKKNQDSREDNATFLYKKGQGSCNFVRSE